MKMSYQPLEGGARKSINIKVTSQHANSSYGQPVLVMPDGGLLGVESWVLLDYHIESVTAAELDLLRRSPLAWEGVSPVAGQIAAATPRVGRPVASNPRRRINLTLTADEIGLLAEIGGGNVSQGISRLLAEYVRKT